MRSVEDLLGAVERALGLGHSGIDATAAAGAFACLRANGFLFGGEARDRLFGVRGKPLLALAFRGELHEPQIELGDAVLGARLFAVEILQRDIEAVQRRAGARLRLAQLGQCGGGQCLTLGGFRLGPGTIGNRAHADVFSVLGLRHLIIGSGPAQMIQRRFRLAHLRRHRAVADRLPRLLLQPSICAASWPMTSSTRSKFVSAALSRSSAS